MLEKLGFEQEPNPVPSEYQPDALPTELSRPQTLFIAKLFQFDICPSHNFLEFFFSFAEPACVWSKGRGRRGRGSEQLPPGEGEPGGV